MDICVPSFFCEGLCSGLHIYHLLYCSSKNIFLSLFENIKARYCPFMEGFTVSRYKTTPFFLTFTRFYLTITFGLANLKLRLIAIRDDVALTKGRNNLKLHSCSHHSRTDDTNWLCLAKLRVSVCHGDNRTHKAVSHLRAVPNFVQLSDYRRRVHKLSERHILLLCCNLCCHCFNFVVTYSYRHSHILQQ